MVDSFERQHIIDPYLNTLSVKPMFAVMAGSKSYNLEGPESDLDLRFVFVPKKKLSIFSEPDSFNHSNDNGLDVVGLSITKALRLAVLKQNPTLLEWLLAKDVIIAPSEKHRMKLKTLTNLLKQIDYSSHFTGVIHSNLKNLSGNLSKKKDFKQVLQAIRAYLMREANKEGRFEIDVSSLLEKSNLPGHLKSQINEIFEKKRYGVHSLVFENIDELVKVLKEDKSFKSEPVPQYVIDSAELFLEDL